MVKKIFGAKSITHLIYGLLMLMPFVAIGVTCAYVVCNKNAYQSYYGKTINEEQYQVLSNTNQLEINKTYNLKSNAITPVQNLTVSTNRITVANVKLNSEPTLDLSNIARLSLFNNYSQSSTTLMVYFYDYLGNNITSKSNYDLTFTYLGISQNDNDVINNVLSQSNNLFSISYNKDSYLDNVFYYAVDEIIKENNIGLIDFTSWFNGLVLPSNNVNNRFIGYANWYMNYAILISCVYILFLCLLWFVNFARKLLDRGMNYDF